MQISENKNKRNLISLTPLIDVVFILLVFFMLASSFVEWQFIELGVGEPEPVKVDLTNQSFIKVGFNQHYTLNDKVMSLEEITANIREQVRKRLDHPVLIQPEDDLPLQQLVVVLDSVGEIAGPNISLIKDER